MKKKSENDQITDMIKEILDYGWDMVLSLYILSILVVLPFYFEEGYAHIGTDKAMFFRRVILCFSWAVSLLLAGTGIRNVTLCVRRYRSSGPKAFREMCREYCRQNISVTDICAAVYGISVVLSYCFSRYKSEALWGTAGWYMGLIPQVTVVLSYFLISRCWKGHKWIPLTVLPVSAVVFLLGYLNRFDIYPIEMAYADPSFISTIGNINWYCGYLMSVFFGSVCLLWQGPEWKSWVKWLLGAYVFLGFATLLTHGSASGLLGLAMVLLVSYLMSVQEGKRMENWWQIVTLLGGAGSFTYLLRQIGLVTVNYTSEGSELLAGNMLIIIMTIVSFAICVFLRSGNKKGKYHKKLFQIMGKVVLAIVLILPVIYVLLTGINTITEGKILEMTPLSDVGLFRFTPEWGSLRGATFLAGVKCFAGQDLVHKLFGVGPDCMAACLYAEGSDSLLAMIKEIFMNRSLTNAHNEWLTLLVNAGLLGAASFVGMMVSAIWRYLRVGAGGNNIKVVALGMEEKCQKDRQEHRRRTDFLLRGDGIIVMACGFCLLAYTANNMISFQQTMSLATISIVLGVGEHYSRKLK